ncbi:MAG: hypothetical protein ACRDS0_31905 [Pseudonocardiaceae bacterium]
MELLPVWRRGLGLRTYPARHRAILGHARDGLRSGHGNAGSKQDGPEQARKYHGGLSHVRAAAGSALDPT